jgi:uncharacterized membrane protein YqhA
MVAPSPPGAEPAPGPEAPSSPSPVEAGFERALWSSRFVVLLAVMGSLAASLAMFFVATSDTVVLVSHLAPFADASLAREARQALHTEAVAHVVEIVDGYLLATVLLIFAFGLYELFISPIEVGKRSETSGVLVIRDLDGLKERLGKVIVMIMVVELFSRVLTLRTEKPLDLVWMAGAIALAGVALWLTHAGGGAKTH